MSRHTLPTLAVAAVTTVLITGIAWGLATTHTVARRTEKVAKSLAADQHWPEGALELVNDPLRWRVHEVWVNGTLAHYTEYRPESSEDLKGLVQRICNDIPWNHLTVHLHPDAEARFVSALDEYAPGNRVTMVLCISKPGRFQFDDPQNASPASQNNAFPAPGLNHVLKGSLETRLTLYTGGPHVDLDALQIPPHVPVVLPRASIYIDETTVAYKAMVDFAREHEERRVAIRPHGTAGPEPSNQD